VIWRLIYNSVLIPLGWLSFQLIALVDAKTRRGIRGRRDLFAKLEAAAALWKDKSPRIWIHASSLGEFEQAKPIISSLRAMHPELIVVVSFFSPSGYENSLSYREANLVTYIPFDSARNAARFVELVRPTVAVVMRYDLWPNHIWRLGKLRIPTLLVNATMRKNSVRNFPLFRMFHRSLYDSLHAILTVSDHDRDLFLSYRLPAGTVETAGDTRYDQVVRRCDESKKKRFFPVEALEGKRVIVVGSCWQEDERLLVPVLRDLVKTDPDVLTILVPHEPTMTHLSDLEARMNGSVSSLRFSQIVSYAGENVVIVDSIGVLVSLYQYAHLVYVGGGFGDGIHNVLEPAVYRVPVVFGPNHENSQEARELLSRGAVIRISDGDELRDAFVRLLGDEGLRLRMGQTAGRFIDERQGATAKILSHITKLL
jgi:3-deoxy-D-manno-octulosonic-acid transferase